jgi:uncharacterized protein
MRRLEIRLVEGKGRGVFTTKNIKNGEIIERAPFIFIPGSDREFIDETALVQYYFFIAGGNIAIALGYGSLYNHSSEPNSKFEQIKDMMVFSARRNICRGQEITVDYTGGGQIDLGFTPRL